MKTVFLILLLTVGIAFNAAADVWQWVDVNGDTHYVDTNRPIYTWTDEYGKVYYSDKPDHADAVSVELIWVSAETLDEVKGDQGDKDGRRDGSSARPGETAEERAEREAAEAYYCKRATEIYESYLTAPKLYRTNDDGEREFLSDGEAAATIAQTKTQMDEICG